MGTDVVLVETPHFRVLGACVEPRTTSRLDNDLTDAIVAELVPLGLVPDSAAFERVFVRTVVGSAPTPGLAWGSFYRNTLARLREPATAGSGSVATFARIYAEVADLVVGASVLDVGSCFGFLPLLLAERRPDVAVVGSGIAAGSAILAGRVSATLRSRAAFVTADALRLPFDAATVDTVTLVHVLEHLPAPEGLAALHEALRVARRRVIVAVPLEERADPAFGHVRTFSMTELAALGAATGWRSRTWVRDGGWLLLDRDGADASQGR
ncbi:MAG: mycofactocin oligosaccharide methyltransferase MftM [Dermatophilaceae bacterium]